MPGLLFLGRLTDTPGRTDDVIGGLFFTAIVAAVAGIWSWVGEQVRPRD